MQRRAAEQGNLLPLITSITSGQRAVGDDLSDGLSRRIRHLLSELCAEGFEVRFEEPNISTHHAKVRNLLSFNPEIDRLRADAKEESGFANRQRNFV